MSRMPARFIGQKIGKKASEVYEIWSNMGLVIKDKYGDWILTDLGKKIGGKMSNSNYLHVPIFDFEMIKETMIDFYNKNVK
jgi:hypothetical protein